jgi:hypothetical protein
MFDGARLAVTRSLSIEEALVAKLLNGCRPVLIRHARHDNQARFGDE